MSKRWTGIVLFVVMSWGLSAFAGPQIGIGDPDCSSWVKYASTYGDITDVKAGDTLTITPNASGGGFFGFCNSTGSDWTFIHIDFYTTSLTPPNGVNCTTDIFATCDQSRNGNIYDLYFHGVGGSDHGVPANFLMTINLFSNCDPTNVDCSGASGGWQGITLTGGLNTDAPTPPPPAVPEPASIALLSSGLAGLWQYRRVRKQR